MKRRAPAYLTGRRVKHRIANAAVVLFGCAAASIALFLILYFASIVAERGVG